MRAIVCGGRDFDDYLLLFRGLERHKPTLVIEGGARGADRMAREWALVRGVHYQTVEAQWDLYGKRAGHLRNSAMLAYKPDAVIAFPGGRGTADMVRQAREAKVPVYEIEYTI